MSPWSHTNPHGSPISPRLFRSCRVKQPHSMRRRLGNFCHPMTYPGSRHPNSPRNLPYLPINPNRSHEPTTNKAHHTGLIDVVSCSGGLKPLARVEGKWETSQPPIQITNFGEAEPHLVESLTHLILHVSGLGHPHWGNPLTSA